MTGILDLDGKELERELDRIVKANPKTYRFWTKKEEIILSRLYPKTNASVIAKVLGRSMASIETKACDMGLRHVR